MKIIVKFVFIFLAMTTVTHAQILPKLGENKIATTSAQFLKIGVGARAASLGESFVAIADDASSLYWNPAGITLAPDRSIYFARTKWAVELD